MQNNTLKTNTQTKMISQERLHPFYFHFPWISLKAFPKMQKKATNSPFISIA